MPPDDCMHEYLARNHWQMMKVFLLTAALWILYPILFGIGMLAFWTGFRKIFGCSLALFATLGQFYCFRQEALISGPRRNLKMSQDLASAQEEIDLIRARAPELCQQKYPVASKEACA